MNRLHELSKTTLWLRYLVMLVGAVGLVALTWSCGKSVESGGRPPETADESQNASLPPSGNPQFNLTASQLNAQLRSMGVAVGVSIVLETFREKLMSLSDFCVYSMWFNRAEYWSIGNIRIAVGGLIHNWVRHVGYSAHSNRRQPYTGILTNVTQAMYQALIVTILQYMATAANGPDFFYGVEDPETMRTEFYINWDSLLATGIGGFASKFIADGVSLVAVRLSQIGGKTDWKLTPAFALGGFKVIMERSPGELADGSDGYWTFVNAIPIGVRDFQRAVRNVFHGHDASTLRRRLLNHDYVKPKFVPLDARAHDVSLRCRNTDWAPGKHKATCGNNMTIAGLAQDGRILCRSVSDAYHFLSDYPLAVARADIDHFQNTGYDWAPWHSKSECPVNHYMVGISLRSGGDLSGDGEIACLPSPGLVKNNRRACRTVAFENGDNRGSAAGGGDFAPYAYKGQCENTEYAAGYARNDRKNIASFLLCCMP